MPYYSVVVDPGPDALGYTAWALSLPECRVQGDTVAAAIATVRPAIESRLQRLADEGHPPPADVAPLIVSVEVAVPSSRRRSRLD